MRINRRSFLIALPPALVCLAGLVLAARMLPVGFKGSSAAEPARGSLVIVGGGDVPAAVWNHFVDLAGGENARLVVIPTATEEADEGPLHPGPANPCWDELYESRKVKALVFLHTRRTDQANDPAFVRPLTEATGVWLDGGDQALLVAAYKGSAVEREVKNVLARGGVVGGTSAGAAVMSEVMIRDGDLEAEIGVGFGLLPGFVVDQHFSQRQRLPRLEGVLAKYPHYLGLGIDEDTAVVVRGRTLTVLGNNQVRVCLPAGRAREEKVKVFGHGERIDLAALGEGEAKAGRPLLARTGPRD
jgi:cyanophycinase